MHFVTLEDLVRRQTVDPVAADLNPLFIRELAKNLSRLEEAVKQGEDRTAARLCHRMNSAASLYGYKALAGYLTRWERSLAAGNLTAAQLLADLHEVIARMMQSA